MIFTPYLPMYGFAVAHFDPLGQTWRSFQVQLQKTRAALVYLNVKRDIITNTSCTVGLTGPVDIHPLWMWVLIIINNNGPNGHLFYVGGDLMMRRGMLPIIMLPDGDLRIALHLVPFWILTIWGSVHIEEAVVGWRNQLRMKTSDT